MGALADEVPLDWYADAFSAAGTLLPWSDDVEGDVDRALEVLAPLPEARILDLACGAGLHAIELASRGFSVVGVDISRDLIGLGSEIAAGLEKDQGCRFELEYVHADLRDLEFADEFDIVLNLHSGAVGYFEDDVQNRRTFATIGRSLRPGGRTLMQLPNVLHAQDRLPAKTWTEGEWALELLDRHWNPAERYVEGAITPIVLEDPGSMESIPFRQRLYSVEELFELFGAVGMSLEAVFDETGSGSTLTESQAEIFVVASRD